MTTTTISGFLNVDKPDGMTSHDVVARIRRLVGRKVKVGHAGTLDPAATGVLPVAIGQATRLLEYFTDTRKGYDALVCLGKSTTTDDAEGEILLQAPVPPLTQEHIETLLASFRGTIMQVPPMYAAIHHQGKKLYELAREGKSVERPPREVTIEALAYLPEKSSPDCLALAVTCHKGTYIRSLARDIGEQIGCGGYLSALVRTFVGPFHLRAATPLSRLLDEPELLPQVLAPPEMAVLHWQKVSLETWQCQKILQGRVIQLPAGTIADDVVQVRAHDPQDRFIALLRRNGDMWHPAKVFPPSA